MLYYLTILRQYTADTISWGAIGARTTESQVKQALLAADMLYWYNKLYQLLTCAGQSQLHRELASSLRLSHSCE